MACGGEMVLIKAIEDWTMPVLGFERHAYMCSGCGITEQLTAFNKQANEKHDAEVVAILAPPPVAPTAPIENHRTAQGFLERVLAKIRGNRIQLGRTALLAEIHDRTGMQMAERSSIFSGKLITRRLATSNTAQHLVCWAISVAITAQTPATFST